MLTYTTSVLDEDVEVIGEVSAEIWFRSSLAHADVFVRLCDVGPDGVSHNICDGLTSLSGANEAQQCHRPALANRLPIQARPPHQGPGLQRRFSPLCP